jgi:hypothetical protein
MVEPLVMMASASAQHETRVTMNVTALPPRDPLFALAPELKLHRSEFDGALVVNSREVSGAERRLCESLCESGPARAAWCQFPDFLDRGGKNCARLACHPSPAGSP